MKQRTYWVLSRICRPIVSNLWADMLLISHETNLFFYHKNCFILKIFCRCSCFCFYLKNSNKKYEVVLNLDFSIIDATNRIRYEIILTKTHSNCKSVFLMSIVHRLMIRKIVHEFLIMPRLTTSIGQREWKIKRWGHFFGNLLHMESIRLVRID